MIESVLQDQDHTLKDLLTAMLSRFDKDQKLSEIKLSDFMALYLEMQSLKTKD